MLQLNYTPPILLDHLQPRLDTGILIVVEVKVGQTGRRRLMKYDIDCDITELKGCMGGSDCISGSAGN